MRAGELAARKRDIARYIAEDSWTVTVYRKGATAGDPETTYEFTGRIAPAIFRATAQERVPFAQPGEVGVSKMSWCVVAPFDTAPLSARDELKAVQGSITRRFRVLHSVQYAYKIEAILEDLQ